MEKQKIDENAWLECRITHFTTTAAANVDDDLL